MVQDIIVALGGRVAEELIFDDITTGASQDIKQATATARAYGCKIWLCQNSLGTYQLCRTAVRMKYSSAEIWDMQEAYSEDVAREIDDRSEERIIDDGICTGKDDYILSIWMY